MKTNGIGKEKKNEYNNQFENLILGNNNKL